MPDIVDDGEMNRRQINEAVAQLFTEQFAIPGITAEFTVCVTHGVARVVKLGKLVLMKDGEQRFHLIPSQSHDPGGPRDYSDRGRATVGAIPSTGTPKA